MVAPKKTSCMPLHVWMSLCLGPFFLSLLYDVRWRRPLMLCYIISLGRVEPHSWWGIPWGRRFSHMSLVLNQVVQNLNLRWSLFQGPCFMLWERGCFDGAWGPGNPRHPQRWNPHTRACHCQVQNLITLTLTWYYNPIAHLRLFMLMFWLLYMMKTLTASRDWQRRPTLTVQMETRNSSRSCIWPL